MPAYVSLKGDLTKDDFLRLYKKCKDAKQARRYHAMYPQLLL